MMQVVWGFVVKEWAVGQFTRAHGPGGPWERLFRGYSGSLGTPLLRDADNPRRFLTVDSWETGAQRKGMLAKAKEQYVNLDELLDELTEDQDEIGTFRLLTDTAVRAGPTAMPGKKRGGHRRNRRRRGEVDEVKGGTRAGS